MRHQQQVTKQPEEISTKSKQHRLAGLQACLPDTHISMRRVTLEQQAKTGWQSSSDQHNMQWNMQQQSTHMTQRTETHWDHADAPTAGATAARSPAAWQSKAANISAKPLNKDPALQPAGSSAEASGPAAAAVLDLSSPGRTGSDNWVKPHRVQPGSTLINGRIGLDLSVHDSHTNLPPWSKAMTTTHQVQQQHFNLLTEGEVDAAAHASAASAFVKGDSGRVVHAGEHLHSHTALGQLQSSQQCGFALEAAALQQSVPTAALAGKADRTNSLQSGSSSAADVAAAAAAEVRACSNAPMETDTNEATATEDLGPTVPPFAPRHKRQLAAGTKVLQSTLQQQQDLSGGWWGARVDSEAADRHQDSDDVVSREMPNLKKLRTMVQGLRVDSSDDLAGLSSPAAADTAGSFMPTHPYSSPKMDQTTKSLANLDCGSAKGSPNVVRQSQKQSGLSRFAPVSVMATAAPRNPAVAAAGVCGDQAQQHQQAGAFDQHGFDEAAVADNDVAMHHAASQSAEAVGLTPHDDEQWLKHHRELQQLKQQQEALRALLQQAEQHVRTPATKDEEDLSTEVHGKVTPPAAQVPDTGPHGDSSSEGSQGRRTAESDAERVAAQILAQEEGDWERAMQRMLNLVHSTMQSTNSTNISSNDRVAQLKRTTSGSASPLRRSASPAAAKQPSSPYAAAAIQHASPYFCSSTAAPAAADASSCGQRGSPYPAAGPLSAVKLAWPMVPTSAVGSPVGSPAPCSPMVPSSAVGSPVMAPVAAAAGDDFAAGGGVRGMILPTSGWDTAAADPAAFAGTARCGSPVQSQHGMVPDGYSPSGGPSAAAAAAAAGARSRSPVCGAQRRVRQSTRQQSRMAPTPQRTSFTSITSVNGDSRCTRSAAAVAAAELGITSAGPGTRTYSAAKAAAASAAAAVAAAEHYSTGAGQFDPTAAEPAAGALSVDPHRNLDFAAAGRLESSISAAGPGTYPDAAAATDVAYSQSAAFVMDATAATGVAPRLRGSATPEGSDSQDTTAAATAAAAAAAVPTLADVLGIGLTLAPDRHQGYRHYAGAATAASVDEVVTSQQLQQQHSQAGLTAAAAAGSFAAHSGASAAPDEAQHQQLQQQQAVNATAAAAAALFSNVPTLSVDAVLDDAGSWLFGANGLLPDTPGPNNFMARPGQVGAGDENAQQQQQALAQAQMYSGNALGGATTAAATSLPDRSNGAAAAAAYAHLEQQQMMMPAAEATAAEALQPMLQQEQQQAEQQCFPTAMHGVETATAAASQSSQPTADSAGASTAMYGMHTAAESWHYDAAAAAMTWQHHCATTAAIPSYQGGDVAIAMHHYQQQQQQLGSLPQQDAVTAPAAAAAAASAAGDSEGSQELGTDKDDIALLQVLLGWAGDEV